MAVGAQTADRALGLLLLAVESETPLSLAELGHEAGLNKAGTYRLVQTLVERSFLEKEPGGRGYVAGTGLIVLAGTVMRKLSVRQSAQPMLRRIADETSETVSIDVRHMCSHVCVDVIESVRPIRRVVTVGEMVALYDGTASKAILSWLAEADFEDIMMRAVEVGRDVKRLREHVKRARRDGYFAAVGDRIAGAGALSVPFFDLLGVKGSVTVSGPGDRLTLDAMKKFAPMVREECAALSHTLGYAPDSGNANGHG
jgi:IclR family acetate operon transcriptional repressor